MFKRLDLYFARKFIGALVYSIMLWSVVAVIFDVTEKMDNFLDHRLPLITIVTYYVNFIPNLMDLLFPLITFIATLYFTSRMANNSEIIAILSSGVSYYRLIRPYVVVALLLCFADIALKNYVIPKASTYVIDFEVRYVEASYNYEAQHIHRQLDNRTYFYARNIDYSNSRAYKFSIEKFNGQQLFYKLRAEDAFFDSTKNIWTAHNYVLREIGPDQQEKITVADSIKLKIPLTIDEFGKKVKSTGGMTTPELNRFIAREKFKGESLLNFYYVEKYRRTASPFSIPILVLIAVSLATRKVRGGMGTHLFFGIITAASFELFSRFSTTFATNSDLSPLLAVWIPNFLYGGLAAYLLKRAQK